MKRVPWEDDFELDPTWDFVYPPEAKLFDLYAESDWWTQKSNHSATELH